MFANFYSNKRVFLTGHTGFKGSWLAEWLLMLGAEVHGYALDPQPHETLFGQLGLAERMAGDTRGDLADRAALQRSLDAANPDIVFHLAAQPLVRLSYEIPVETFATNVMGTAHLLEAVRMANRPCAVVCITTDKCYENREWLHAYREEDAMGGHDPYSASKGAAELVIASYRRSFFGGKAESGKQKAEIRLASARAGNVIGGGDWATDRIVPDCIRALRAGQSIPVRNKIATRPWQHVLEPLSGYLTLGAAIGKAESGKQAEENGESRKQKAEMEVDDSSADASSFQLSAFNSQLSSADASSFQLSAFNSQLSSADASSFQLSAFNSQLSSADASSFQLSAFSSQLSSADASSFQLSAFSFELLCSPFNFGPALTSNRTVAELVQELLKHTGGEWTDASDPNAVHEASKLNLAIDKAFHLLQWQPVWDFATTIARTAEWYQQEAEGANPHALTLRQIESYCAAAASKGLPWAEV